MKIICGIAPNPKQNIQRYYRLQTKFGARWHSSLKGFYIFTLVFFCRSLSRCLIHYPSGGLCPWSHVPSRGVSVQEGLCPGGGPSRQNPLESEKRALEMFSWYKILTPKLWIFYCVMIKIFSSI